MVGRLFAGCEVCTCIAVGEGAELVAVNICTGILGHIGGGIVNGESAGLIIEAVFPDRNVAERLEVHEDGLVETGIPVGPRVLGIVSGTCFEELLAVGHLIVDDDALGRVYALVAADSAGFARIEELGLVAIGGSEILRPNDLGAVDVGPIAVIGGCKLISTFIVGTVYNCLGRVERFLPLGLAVCPVEKIVLWVFRVVEQRGCHDKGKTAAQCKHDILVDPSLDGVFLCRNEFFRLVKVFLDECDAIVESVTGDRVIISEGVYLVDDGNAAVTLDKIRVHPCAKEIDFAQETVLGRFLDAAGLHLLDEDVHLADTVVCACPDVQDGSTAAMCLSAFGLVHHVAGGDETVGHIPGGAASITEESLVGNTGDVAFLHRIGQRCVECVHICFGKTGIVEHGSIGNGV